MMTKIMTNIVGRRRLIYWSTDVRQPILYSITDERIVFVSITNKSNLHVHCWCVTFDDQKFRTGMCIGTGNNNGNGDDQIVPCMSLGTTPDAQLDLGFLNY